MEEQKNKKKERELFEALKGELPKKPKMTKKMMIPEIPLLLQFPRDNDDKSTFAMKCDSEQECR